MTIIVSWAGHGFVAYLNLATLHRSGFDSNDAIGQCLIKLIVLRIGCGKIIKKILEMYIMDVVHYLQKEKRLVCWKLLLVCLRAKSM